MAAGGDHGFDASALVRDEDVPLHWVVGESVRILAGRCFREHAAVLLGFGPLRADSAPWQQLGRAVTSRPGKVAHFYRLAPRPRALGVVASSSSSKPIRLTWFSYCEEQSDDGMTAQNQAVVTEIHRVVAYPPVFGAATLCTVSVTIRVVGGRASAAIFDY